jgi:hypothetical protein
MTPLFRHEIGRLLRQPQSSEVDLSLPLWLQNQLALECKLVCKGPFSKR